MPKTLRRNALNLGRASGRSSISPKARHSHHLDVAVHSLDLIARQRRHQVERRSGSHDEHRRGHLELRGRQIERRMRARQLAVPGLPGNTDDHVPRRFRADVPHLQPLADRVLSGQVMPSDVLADDCHVRLPPSRSAAVKARPRTIGTCKRLEVVGMNRLQVERRVPAALPRRSVLRPSTAADPIPGRRTAARSPELRPRLPGPLRAVRSGRRETARAEVGPQTSPAARADRGARAGLPAGRARPTAA